MKMDASRLDDVSLDFLYGYVAFWSEMEKQKWTAIAQGLSNAGTAARGRI